MTNEEIVAYRDALAAKLRSVRAGRGLEQANLAARMQALGYTWHRQTVSSVESGGRRITAEEILGLSIALETSISELMAPITNSARGKFVGLPGGAVIAASEVSGSAGAGMPGGFIRWDGDTPVLPSHSMLDSIGNLPDTTAKAREAMTSTPPVVVLSDEEMKQETQRMMEAALPALASALSDIPTNESAAEREARLAKYIENVKRDLPGLVATAFEDQAAEMREGKKP